MATMPGTPMACPVEDRALDPLSAAAFLEEAAGPLHRALTRPGCADSVSQAMRHQEGAHRSWLALMGTAYRGEDDELLTLLERLYGLHGTVAGRLERGFSPLLGPTAEERLRLLLVGQLQRLTARAITRLLAHTAPATGRVSARASAAPCGWPRRGARPRH